MTYKRKPRQTNWGRRGIQCALALAVLGITVDYGKHVILKSILENEIAQSGGVVTLESMSASLWPLFESHLILKNFHVNVSGTPLAATEVTIRQGWKEWRLAHIHATDVSSDGTVKVRDVQGILDTANLKTQVNVTQLVLTDIQAKLPLLSFSGDRATFDFLYDMTTYNLSLTADAPEMAFASGATFGLKGEGVIYTKEPIQGKMDVKIKNIDKMMKELVAVGVVKESEAGLVTAGSDFLGKIGLHDLTLPLKIQEGEVTLGPITLFKVGKQTSPSTPLP
jgi:hypothetical protein